MKQGTFLRLFGYNPLFFGYPNHNASIIQQRTVNSHLFALAFFHTFFQQRYPWSGMHILELLIQKLHNGTTFTNHLISTYHAPDALQQLMQQPRRHTMLDTGYEGSLRVWD